MQKRTLFRSGCIFEKDWERGCSTLFLGKSDFETRSLPVSLCAKCIKGWKDREILNNSRFLFSLTSTQRSTSLTYLHCCVCVTIICRSRKIILPKTSPFEMLLRNRQTQLCSFCVRFPVPSQHFSAVRAYP